MPHITHSQKVGFQAARGDLSFKHYWLVSAGGLGLKHQLNVRYLAVGKIQEKIMRKDRMENNELVFFALRRKFGKEFFYLKVLNGGW